MEEKKREIVIDPKSGDVTEQLQKLIEEQNNNKMPTNRKQRRAMEKRNKKQEKRLQKYLERHPEAMKIDWDEEAVKKVEEDENKKKYATMVDAMRKSNVASNEESDTIVIDVPFTELAED